MRHRSLLGNTTKYHPRLLHTGKYRNKKTEAQNLSSHTLLIRPLSCQTEPSIAVTSLSIQYPRIAHPLTVSMHLDRQSRPPPLRKSTEESLRPTQPIITSPAPATAPLRFHPLNSSFDLLSTIRSWQFSSPSLPIQTPRSEYLNPCW